MSVGQVHLCVDVTRDGDAITGTVTRANGDQRTFAGRLGLYSAIDDEIEACGTRGDTGGTTDAGK